MKKILILLFTVSYIYGNSQPTVFPGSRVTQYFFGRIAQTVTSAPVNISVVNQVSGNITNASGVFTLTGGKNYLLDASFYASSSVGVGYAVIEWVDTNTGTVLDDGAKALIVVSNTPTWTHAPRACIIYKPTVTQTVNLKLTTLTVASLTLSSSGGSNGASTVSINEIPTSY